MANPCQIVESNSVARVDMPSRAWLVYWLLFYLTPFALLFLFICVFGETPVDGRTFLVLLLGLFACGLGGSAWAFHSAKLPARHFTLCLLGTIVAYGIGIVLFSVACILIFGVIAT